MRARRAAHGARVRLPARCIRQNRDAKDRAFLPPIRPRLPTHLRLQRSGLRPITIYSRPCAFFGLEERPYEAVVPAKRARLRRASASRDPVIHGRSECANGVAYWIPALTRL